MDDFVAKPIRADELRRALAQCGLEKDLEPVVGARSPSVSDEKATLDAEVIENVRALPGRHGGSLWPELLELFLREAPLRLDECARALAEGAPGEAARVAHSLAGSCASVGAGSMRIAALAFERAALTVPAEAGTALGQLRLEWERTRTAFEQLTSSSS
jgi:HPt (histidine-containing phosphotransfer) domain-containing protein